MTGLGVKDREERILAGKTDLLFRGHLAVPGNMAVASLTAFLLRGSFPAWFLLTWLVATILVGLARLRLHRRYRDVRREGLCGKEWARAFTWGAFAAGAMWGVLCGALAFWGTMKAFVLVTFVAAGMTAGALATFSPYMPAYLAYAASFTLPLAVASLVNPDEVIAGDGVLTLFYFVVITLTCRYFSRFVERTVELQVDNEILRGHLRNTRRERDRARTEKWSTLAQLSHELRTPLNAIMGFSEAMRDEVLGAIGNRRYKDYASHIHASGKQLLTLTDELLLISQGESGSLVLKEEPVDLGQMITAAVEHKAEAAEKAGLSLSSRIAPDLPQLKGDRSKLRQMLRYLLGNALKFTPAGGLVTISAEVDSNRAITLTIEDTGIGIDKADIPRALRPFGRIATPLTNSSGGVGLGLPIAVRLAELHGASLRLDSVPDCGTRVIISFPPQRALAAEQTGAIAAA